MLLLRYCGLLVSLIVALAVPFRTNAAALKVLGDDKLQPALTKIAEAFARTDPGDVAFDFAPSVDIRNKVIGGESADVIVIDAGLVDELATAGKLDAPERPVVGRIGLGLATRANGPNWNILTTDSFKSALLEADLLFVDKVADDALARAVDALALGAVRQKIVRLDSGEVLARVLADSGNDIAIARMSDLVVTKGLKVIGALPSAYQNYVAYVAVAVAGAQDSDKAKKFVRFLTLPQARGDFFGAGVN